MPRFLKNVTFAYMTFVAATILSAQADAQMTAYTIDPSHSQVEFEIRHLLSKVRGAFREVSGEFKFDSKAMTGSDANFTIKSESIDTGNKKRDDHLRNADFFDAAKYPTLTFKGKSFTKTGDKKFKLDGDLTIKATTKPVTWDVEYLGKTKDAKGNEVQVFAAKTKINRLDYDVKWNKVAEGSNVLGDDVDLSVAIEAQPKKK